MKIRLNIWKVTCRKYSEVHKKWKRFTSMELTRNKSVDSIPTHDRATGQSWEIVQATWMGTAEIDLD